MSARTPYRPVLSMSSHGNRPWVVGATAAVGAAAVLFAAWSQRRMADRKRRESPYIVVVPGGGLTLDGQPTEWVRRRLQEATAIYKRRKSNGEACVIVTLSGGTPHKPMPIDPLSKFQVFEAEGNAKCLIRQFGVDPSDVFEENWSIDTIGNAFMFRAAYTDVAGWRKLVVVNNEFHLPRTRAIFDKVFSLNPAPASGGPYSLEYVEVPNDGVAVDALAARKEREAKSTESFKKNTQDISSMQDMHSFLFRDHLAYASKRLLKDKEPVDPKALATY